MTNTHDDKYTQLDMQIQTQRENNDNPAWLETNKQKIENEQIQKANKEIQAPDTPRM